MPFGRGHLFHLLKNRIYRGEIVHKGAVYPGEHEPVVPLALWDAVQDKLAGNGPGASTKVHAAPAALLTGILVDGLGRRMTPSQSNKKTKRYRYYVTLPTEPIDQERPVWRVPAHDLERIVADRLVAFLEDPQAILSAVGTASADAQEARSAIEAAAAEAATLQLTATDERSRMVREWVAAVRLDESHVEIDVRLATLAGVEPIEETAASIITLSAATERVRIGHEIKLVVPAVLDTTPTGRDDRLARLIAEAFVARERVLKEPDRSIDEIAKKLGRCRTRLATLAE